MDSQQKQRGLTHQERAGISFQVIQYLETLRSKGSIQKIPEGSDAVHAAACKALAEVLAMPGSDPVALPQFPQLPSPAQTDRLTPPTPHASGQERIG